MIRIRDTAVNILTGYTDMTDTAKYTSRETAGGVGIVDGALAYVKKIQGDTVKSKNIFNRYYGTRTGGAYITETTDEKIIVRQQQDGKTYASANIPIENPDYYVGKTLYFSAKWTVSGANKGAIRIMWLNESTGIAGGQVKENLTSGAVVSGIVPERPANATGLYLMLYSNVDGTALQGDTVTYTDIMISTENVPYTPYFSGLKHAFFERIKSTGKNLFNADIFAQAVVDKGQGSFETFQGKRCLKIVHNGGQSGEVTLPAGIVHGIKFMSYVDGTYTPSFITLYKSDGTTATYMSNGKTREWVESKFFSSTYTIGIISNWCMNAGNPIYIDLDSFVFYGETEIDYEPYKESIYKLPVPVELPAYDSVLPPKGVIERKTGIVESATGFTDEEIATYKNAIVSVDRKTLAYELETAEYISLDGVPETHTAWNGGTETIEQGETDNSAHGAECTMTTAYKIAGVSRYDAKIPHGGKYDDKY